MSFFKAESAAPSKLLSYALPFCLIAAAWSLTSEIPVLGIWSGTIFLALSVLAAAIGGIRGAAIAQCVGLPTFLLVAAHTGQNDSARLIWSGLVILCTSLVGYFTEQANRGKKRGETLSSDLANLRSELSTNRADVARFQDLSIELSSGLDTQKMMESGLRAVASLQKSDLAIFLLNDARAQLKPAVLLGLRLDQIASFSDFSFFNTKKRIIVDDIERPGTYFPHIEAADAIGFRALITTPLLDAEGNLLGVIIVFFPSPKMLTEREARVSEMYGRQIANAIRNARAHQTALDRLKTEERRTALLRSLAEASVQINASLTIDSLLQVMTDQARKLIGATYAAATWVPSGDRIRSITAVSSDDPSHLTAIDGSAISAQVNRPVRLSGHSSQPNPIWSMILPEQQGQSWLAAPLLTRDGRNLGLIQLTGKIGGEFTEDDEAILVQLAQMASVAVDNTRLYREAQEQITANIRAQQALEQSKEGIALAQRCAGVALWEWDLQSGTLSWSPEICKLHGHSQESFDGRFETWMQTIHPEDRAKVHQAVATALKVDTEYEIQYRVRHSDGTIRWLETRGQSFFIGSAPFRMLGVAMDVTGRKEAEEKLRTSEKLVTAGRLAASIAHEINNPLAGITNLLYLLRGHASLDDQARSYVRTAEAELKRVNHITKQTLAFYRESTSPTPTNVASLIHEVVEVYSHQIEKAAIRVTVDVDSSTPPIHAFTGELRQVFSNLILNSVEALPEGGHVRIRVKSIERDGRNAVRVVITDNGPGIPQENRNKIFEPFFTTKGEKGTGLGLWVSHGIVQKHEGTMRVYSCTTPDLHGTTFSLVLQSLSEAQNPARIESAVA